MEPHWSRLILQFLRKDLNLVLAAYEVRGCTIPDHLNPSQMLGFRVSECGKHMWFTFTLRV